MIEAFVVMLLSCTPSTNHCMLFVSPPFASQEKCDSVLNENLDSWLYDYHLLYESPSSHSFACDTVENAERVEEALIDADFDLIDQVFPR